MSLMFRGFIKGQEPGKLSVCKHDFAQLLLTSCLTFSINEHIRVNYPALVY